jgi:predicted  nucleic acid-binding Zn-ribbon protein
MSDECTICSHHFDADDPEAFPGLCPDCNTEKNRAAKLDITVEEYRKRFPACDSDQSSLRVLDLLLPIGTCCRCGLESRTYDAGNDERMCLPCARKERAVIAGRILDVREREATYERHLREEQARADSLERRAAEYAMQLDEAKVQAKRDEAVKSHLRQRIQSQEFALETRNRARLWTLDTASGDAKEDAAADAGYAAGYKAGYEASSEDAVALLRT